MHDDVIKWKYFYRVTGPLCGESTGDWWIPAQRPVTRIFYVFFRLRLNKRLVIRDAHYDVTVMRVDGFMIMTPMAIGNKKGCLFSDLDI